MQTIEQAARALAEAQERFDPITDHIVPHKGDMEKFWDSEKNWAARCKPHHDAKTAREDRGFGNPSRAGNPTGSTAAVPNSVRDMAQQCNDYTVC